MAARATDVGAGAGVRAPADHEVFEAGNVELQCGVTLPGARLAYKVYGRLDAARDNVVVYPTRYGGTHVENEYLIGEGRALDPARYCIVVPNLLGNGLSSSPSNTEPPFDRGRFPLVTVYDNVRLQHRLLTEVLGVTRVPLAVGWSMGGQQAYHWAVLYPELVDSIAVVCGSARTSPHNYVFLEGMKAALTADAAWRDGDYDEPPGRGLRAIGRAWAGWALSQAWYRLGLYRELGHASVDDFLASYEELFLRRDANDVLAMIATWQAADVSDNERFEGDLPAALASIQARAFIMPAETDLYFHPDDSAYEVEHIQDAELRPIPTAWGHYAGGGADRDALAFIDGCLQELLARRSHEARS